MAAAPAPRFAILLSHPYDNIICGSIVFVVSSDLTFFIKREYEMPQIFRIRPILFLITFILVNIPTFAAPLVEVCKKKMVWDQPPVLPPKPLCPPCPEPSGRPISYGRKLECAVVKIVPYGYVKWETYFDTREVIGFREVNVILFPSPPVRDKFGRDINARGFWNMTAFETRLGFALTGPDWGDFKTDGMVEGDFRGGADSTIFNFRMRNLFGRITWEHGNLLFGQWWHPLWIPECFPHTLGFAIGAPIDPQAREPQLRLSQRWHWFELITAAAAQHDYASPGPLGVNPIYIERAVIPNLHLQMRAYWKDNVVGVAGDYKRLVPRIVTDNNVKTKEHIDSFIFEAFAAFIHAPWSLRMKAFWAQNGSEHLLISGYGVRTVNSITDVRTYSNTACAGAWLDFSYLFHCDQMELGLFVGGTKNLGSRHRLHIDPLTGQPIIFALAGVAQNLDYVVEVIPRFIFMKDPIRAGVELEVNRASYGTPNACGLIRNGCPVTDYRILFVLYYMF